MTDLEFEKVHSNTEEVYSEILHSVKH